MSVYDEHYTYPLDRTTLDALCSIREMVSLLTTVLNSGHASQLDEVLLVGGASRLSQFTATIRSLVPASCKFVTNVAPMEAVLTGVGIAAFAGSQHNHSDDYACVTDMCYAGVRAQIEGQLEVELVRMGEQLPIVADLSHPSLKLGRTKAKKFYKRLVVGARANSKKITLAFMQYFL